jgi:hypothetical protein
MRNESFRVFFSVSPGKNILDSSIVSSYHRDAAPRIRVRINHPMRIKDVILKSVGFVSEVVAETSEGSEYEHEGTGFFVSVPSVIPGGLTYSYFVTARHVAQRLQGRTISFQVNKVGGGKTQIQSLIPRWYIHPDTDVALVALADVKTLDVIFVSVNSFATAAAIGEQDIGIGDEVFTVGLFDFGPGQHSYRPIIRVGNISMIPSEQVHIDMGSGLSKFVDAYLVESRSIGGISGSPVFVRPTSYIVGLSGENQIRVAGLSDRAPYLLGMMQGHWDIGDINKSELLRGGVNVGIGIVIPAQRILDLLNDPDLVAMRQAADQRYLDRITAKPDERPA